MAGKLARSFRKAKVVGVDIAPGMIKTAKSKHKRKNLSFIINDCEYLPKLDSFDLIISNASLQWMDLKIIAKCIKLNISENGTFLFYTFGPKNLKELERAGFKTNKFPPKQQINGIFKKYFKHISINNQTRTMEFKNIKSLIGYLRGIGANTPTPKKRQNIKKLKLAIKNSPSPFYATFDILFGECR